MTPVAWRGRRDARLNEPDFRQVTGLSPNTAGREASLPIVAFANNGESEPSEPIYQERQPNVYRIQPA